MKWERKSKYHHVSGPYCINSARTGKSIMYSGYHVNELLGSDSDPEVVRKLCDAHRGRVKG